MWESTRALYLNKSEFIFKYIESNDHLCEFKIKALELKNQPVCGGHPFIFMTAKRDQDLYLFRAGSRMQSSELADRPGSVLSRFYWAHAVFNHTIMTPVTLSVIIALAHSGLLGEFSAGDSWLTSSPSA